MNVCVGPGKSVAILLEDTGKYVVARNVNGRLVVASPSAEWDRGMASTIVRIANGGTL